MQTMQIEMHLEIVKLKKQAIFFWLIELTRNCSGKRKDIHFNLIFYLFDFYLEDRILRLQSPRFQ